MMYSNYFLDFCKCGMKINTQISFCYLVVGWLMWMKVDQCCTWIQAGILWSVPENQRLTFKGATGAEKTHSTKGGNLEQDQVMERRKERRPHRGQRCPQTEKERKEREEKMNNMKKCEHHFNWFLFEACGEDQPCVENDPSDLWLPPPWSLTRDHMSDRGYPQCVFFFFFCFPSSVQFCPSTN